MDSSISVIHFLIGTASAGLIATALMTIFVETVSKSKLIKVDMLRAIGSIFSGESERVFSTGAAIHATSGIIFAFIYLFIFELLEVTGIGPLAGVGLLLGAAHGFVLSFFLIVSVAEHHPIAKYREVGLGIAAIYLIAHIIYGTCVGALCGIFGVA